MLGKAPGSRYRASKIDTREVKEKNPKQWPLNPFFWDTGHCVGCVGPPQSTQGLRPCALGTLEVQVRPLRLPGYREPLRD